MRHLIVALYWSVIVLLYFGCTMGTPPQQALAKGECGNNKIEGSEKCDDGFTDACGTCNADCSGPGTGAICGDGFVCAEFEVCDDDHNDNCGTCNSKCSGPGEKAVCGDGLICPELEFCDDGFTDACGTCNADCTWLGTGALCGDGLLCPELEVCEKGDEDACKKCDDYCRTWLNIARCGDGQLCIENEVCDDGFTDVCGTCNADCTGPGEETQCGDNDWCPELEFCDDGYTDACGTCNADCSGPGEETVCGDNVVCPETEVCDDGYTDVCGTCNADCSGLGQGSCGDNFVCPETEVCDDGNELDKDYCSNDCLAITGSCGDGIIQDNEICDDANIYNDDICSNDCQTFQPFCLHDHIDDLDDAGVLSSLSQTTTSPLSIYAQTFLPLCNGWVYVGDRQNKQVILLNAITGFVYKTYQLTGPPADMVIDKENGFLWISLQPINQIAKIDIFEHSIHYLQLDLAANQLRIGNQGNVFASLHNLVVDVVLIDGLDNVIKQQWTGLNIRCMVYNPDQNELITHDYNTLSRWAFDDTHMTLTQVQIRENLILDDCCKTMKISPDYSKITMKTESSIFATDANDLTQSNDYILSPPFVPRANAFSPDGDYLIVEGDLDALVYKIEPLEAIELVAYDLTSPDCSEQKNAGVAFSQGGQLIFSLLACGNFFESAELHWRKFVPSE